MPPTTPSDVAVIIPARYKSTRYPGKPLVPLLGKPMIQWVWERCVSATSDKLVHIATDDERIAIACRGFGAQVILTSPHCLTGTDRVYEAARTIGASHIVNVQGDEPLIAPDDVARVIDRITLGDAEVVNCMAPICEESEFRSPTVPKVVSSPDGRLLYMSRAAIPTDKAHGFVRAYKQVCIYGFALTALQRFYELRSKTPLEQVEDIEILRFLEMGYSVHMLAVESSSVAVDVPGDVPRAERLLRMQLSA